MKVDYIADKTGYHPKVSKVFICNEDSDDYDDNSVALRYDINYRKVFNLKNVGKVDKVSGKSLYMPENKMDKTLDLNENIKNSLIS